MISLLEEIIAGLNESTGLQCYSEMPDGSFKLPMIIVTERTNEVNSLALNGSIQSVKLVYEIQIYSNDIEDIFELQEFVDSYFRENLKLFRRSASNIQQRHPLYYRTMTFTGFVRADEDNLYIL